MAKAGGVRVVIACRVMEPEIKEIWKGNSQVEIRYLEQSLHRVPQKMAYVIQKEIDRVALYAEKIVLGYGLCSKGIVGVKTPRQGLIVPRCQDCIALFLGSPKAYEEAFATKPGTYYLTPGWVAEKKDPLGIIEEEYVPRVGREMAIWAMQQELKHYTHIALINTGVGNLRRLRERARENARVLGKKFEEIQGSLEYFRKLVYGPYSGEDFLVLTPGQKITQDMFLASLRE